MLSSLTLFPTVRGGGLLTAAHPLTGAWQGGVLVQTSQCAASPQRIAPCVVEADSPPESPSEPDPLNRLGGDIVEFSPFEVRLSDACSTLTRADLGAVLRNAADATAEYIVATEFQTGAATNNPSLADATVIGTADTLAEAIACIEATGSADLAGRMLFIHVPAGLAVHIPKSGVSFIDGQWRTPLGNVVVTSPGYTGTSVYGTGEVWASRQHVDTRVYTERRLNTDEGWNDDIALVVFDPCFIVEVETNYQVCGPTSPTDG